MKKFCIKNSLKNIFFQMYKKIRKIKYFQINKNNPFNYLLKNLGILSFYVLIDDDENKELKN